MRRTRTCFGSYTPCRRQYICNSTGVRSCTAARTGYPTDHTAHSCSSDSPSSCSPSLYDLLRLQPPRLFGTTSQLFRVLQSEGRLPHTTPFSLVPCPTPFLRRSISVSVVEYFAGHDRRLKLEGLASCRSYWRIAVLKLNHLKLAASRCDVPVSSHWRSQSAIMEGRACRIRSTLRWRLASSVVRREQTRGYFASAKDSLDYAVVRREQARGYFGGFVPSSRSGHSNRYDIEDEEYTEWRSSSFCCSGAGRN